MIAELGQHMRRMDVIGQKLHQSQNSQNWQCWDQRLHFIKTKKIQQQNMIPVSIEPGTSVSDVLLSELLRRMLLGASKISIWSCSIGSN